MDWGGVLWHISQNTLDVDELGGQSHEEYRAPEVRGDCL